MSGGDGAGGHGLGQAAATLLARLERAHGPASRADHQAERERLATLEARLGYTFSRWELLRVALTHKSWSNERGDGWDSLGVLEFIGDAVLDLVVAQRLWGQFPRAREGTLTRLRASLVAEAPLASCARTLGLGEFLWLGKGARKQGLADHPAVLSDAVEAVVAAVFCDAQLASVDAMAAAAALVQRLMGPVMDGLDEERGVDPKSRLQWEVQGRGLDAPRYEVREERSGAEAGPEAGPGFMARAVLRPTNEEDGAPIVLGEGRGGSHREAEMEAAAASLETLSTTLPRR